MTTNKNNEKIGSNATDFFGSIHAQYIVYSNWWKKKDKKTILNPLNSFLIDFTSDNNSLIGF